jgi:AhpD family alkylhydroperoxidase
MKRAKVPRQVSEKVAIAVQSWIGCKTCLAAHTKGGRAAGLTETDIGWTERAIADVVGLVTLNLLTGAFNLVAGIVPANDDAELG